MYIKERNLMFRSFFVQIKQRKVKIIIKSHKTIQKIILFSQL